MNQLTINEIYDPKLQENIPLPEYLWKERHFYTFYLPFLRLAKKKLVSTEDWSSCVSEAAEGDWLTGLMNRLEGICLRTLVVEIQYCKAGGVLGNGDPQKQYGQFVEGYLRDSSQMVAFWQAYPYLYELVLYEAERYVNFTERILRHFRQDRKELEGDFGWKDGCGQICHLRMDRGDIHGQGRAVAELELADGRRLFYKPGKRSLKVQFTEMLNRLYVRQGLTAWRDQTAAKEDHTWEVGVESEACTAKAERFRYYRRLGIILFLCYQWGLCDIHCENVISHGEFPVLVDVEVGKRRAKRRKMPWGLYSNSVLSVGILPFYIKGEGENWVNPGVLCLDRHQKSTVRHLVLKHPRTSDVCLELEYTDLLLNSDLPGWAEEEEAEVIACLQEGFRRAGADYRELCRGIKRAPQSVPVLTEATAFRYIHRPTNEYAMLLHMLGHPEYMVQREKAENLLRTALERPGNGGVQDVDVREWEVACLLKREIPLFTFYGNSARLYCGEDYVENFFAERPENAAEQRVSVRNLRIQEKLIEVSMAGLHRNQEDFRNCYGRYNMKEFSLRNRREEFSLEETGRKKPEKLPENAETVCRCAAEQIAEQMRNLAFLEKKEVSWWSVNPQFRQKVLWEVTEMPPDLYHGKAGIGLFFHNGLACGVLDSEEDRYLTELLDREMFRYTSQPLSERSSFGAFSGEYSVIYYYQYLYGLTGRKTYLDYAKKHLKKIAGREPEEAYDLMSGASGMALVWLNQWKLTGAASCLAYAEKLLDRLAAFAMAEAPKHPASVPAGMAHGWSGILLAFGRYATLTGSRRYDGAVLAALEAENRWYCPGIHNWQDLHRGEPRDTVAWCHGAAGILLCRMELEKSLNPEIAAAAGRDAARAAEKLQTAPLRRGYCLCHGNLGNVLILRAYAAEQKNRELERLCGAYMRAVAGQFLAGKLHLLPQEKYDFGLMNGLGGIGNALMCSTEQAIRPLILEV